MRQASLTAQPIHIVIAFIVCSNTSFSLKLSDEGTAFVLSSKMTAVPNANYPAFADWLADYPDTVALKRFRRLQLRNLLYYQAELVSLEYELQMNDDLDAQAFPDATKRVTYRWTASMAEEPVTTPVTTSAMYRATILKIRETLRKYSELSQYV